MLKGQEKSLQVNVNKAQSDCLFCPSWWWQQWKKGQDLLLIKWSPEERRRPIYFIKCKDNKFDNKHTYFPNAVIVRPKRETQRNFFERKTIMNLQLMCCGRSRNFRWSSISPKRRKGFSVKWKERNTQDRVGRPHAEISRGSAQIERTGSVFGICHLLKTIFLTFSVRHNFCVTTYLTKRNDFAKCPPVLSWLSFRRQPTTLHGFRLPFLCQIKQRADPNRQWLRWRKTGNGGSLKMGLRGITSGFSGNASLVLCLRYISKFSLLLGKRKGALHLLVHV